MNIFFAALLAFPALSRADQIQALNRGDQSLAAFFATASSAKESIDLATFLFEPCESAPKMLLEVLAKKAKAGIKIRILVDAYNQKQPNKNGLAAYLGGLQNVEYRFFNDSLTLATANGRSHIKAFIVDGRTANGAYIVGGRNISDDYFGLGSKMNYLDQDLLIQGRSAARAQAQFEELWTYGTRAAGQADRNAFANTCLKQKPRDQAVAQHFEKNAKAILSELPRRSCKNVEYAMDRPNFMACPGCNDPAGDEDPLLGEGLERKRVTSMFLNFVASAERDLKIANQYFMPYFRRPLKALERLREEGVKVSVYTNASGDIENVARNANFTCHIQSSAAAYSKGSASVELLTSKGSMHDRWALSLSGAPWRIHTKSAIRDSRDVMVSSWNLDPRSYNVNLESGVVIEGCPELAKDLLGQYTQIQAIAETDRTCSRCRTEILPSNAKKSSFECGGEPLFY